MATTCIYLNFDGTTEEAFTFYRSVFGGEFSSLIRFSDFPELSEHRKMTEKERRGIMHIELPLLGGVRLRGTEAPKSFGFDLTFGNNTYICLEPDTKEEADRLFAALSEGGTVQAPLQDMPWGAYYGDLLDRFGVQWMINLPTQPIK